MVRDPSATRARVNWRELYYLPMVHFGQCPTYSKSLDTKKGASAFFYEKSSIFPLYLSQKAIFTINQHKSLDSNCPKAKLLNWPKSECKFWTFTTEQVRVMGKAFLATKIYGSKTTSHSQLARPFGLHVKQTQRNIACVWLISSRSKTRCLTESDRLILSSLFSIAFP